MHRCIAERIETAAPEFADFADFFTDELGRLKRSDIFLAPCQKVVGRAAVEGFFWPWDKEKCTASGGITAVVGAFLKDVIQLLSIVRRDVFDVGEVFQSSFDLEGTDARRNQFAQVGALIVVFH